MKKGMVMLKSSKVSLLNMGAFLFKSKNSLNMGIIQHDSSAVIENDLGTWVESYGSFQEDSNHSSSKKLSVMILGLRGLPDVQGGIESHVEQLAPLLVKRNLDVKVIVRSPYQPKQIEEKWNGLSLVRIWSPKTKATEAIIHTFLGVIYAAIHRPDVLHIHGIGPALMVPLCKVLGLNVVVTHHGPDYDRQKWGGFAKAMLKLGEAMGMKMSDGRIVISNVIAKLVKEKHAKNSSLIHNGVKLPELSTNRAILEQFGLANQRYILLVSRLVPEKRHLDLINAFNLANLDNCKLVIVGGSDHPDAYQASVYAEAQKNPNIVMTGFQRGEHLKALYTFADLFVLPSSHEGLSIALLEALSFGLPVLVSNIPANTEVNLDAEDYFEMGNVEALASKLKLKVAHPISEHHRQHTRNWVSASYNWEVVANQTVAVYKDIVR
jgi:glycosyltransferase involved in cell wall biosynthesis